MIVKVRWITRLLPEETPFSSKLIAKSMNKIEGSYSSFLQQYVDSAENCTQQIIEIWKITSQFGSQSLEFISKTSEEQKLVIESIFSPFTNIQNNFHQVMSKRIQFELQKSILIVSKQ